jgi:hypothetical protein
MNFSSLDLMFQKGQFSGECTARIYVRTYSNEKGNIFITPDCFSMREIEEQCDRLKQELENIRKKANQKFPKKSK